jgi:hypothetical protein
VLTVYLQQQDLPAGGHERRGGQRTIAGALAPCCSRSVSSSSCRRPGR